MSNISILIIEDEGVVALDIAYRVKKLGYDVAGIKHDFDDTINFLSIHIPDLILCDINLDGQKDGVDVAEYVFNNKKTPVIFITALSDRATLERAKKTLPYGYIVKPFDNHDLLAAIELALYKHSVELEKLSITLDKVNRIATTDLTEREFEMLEDVIAGLNNTQIGDKRHIAYTTVKYHIRKLLDKMQVTNRAEILNRIINVLTAK